jgi:murein DD-endopeptidase MepM/ murein hydrolase activator NlpD
MSKGYRYDAVSNTFKKVTRSVGSVVGGVLIYTIAVLTLTTVLYVVFALLVSTDQEKALLRENRLYRRLYPELEAREQMISGSVELLQQRDNAIYGTLFAADAPSVSPLSAADFLSARDSLPSGNLSLMAGRVEDNFQEVMLALEGRKAAALPPLSLPLRDMDYTQTGASVGRKINPIFQVEADHNGIDLIARQGEPVYATGAGTVKEVVHGSKGHGNVVVIDHGNGYESHYAFLTGITVSRGEKVTAGKKIGAVGTARGSFAPHLHYEVFRDGKVLDPVHLFFASVSPEEYARMMYFAATSMQSMD